MQRRTKNLATDEQPPITKLLHKASVRIKPTFTDWLMMEDMSRMKLSPRDALDALYKLNEPTTVATDQNYGNVEKIMQYSYERLLPATCTAFSGLTTEITT